MVRCVPRPSPTGGGLGFGVKGLRVFFTKLLETVFTFIFSILQSGILRSKGLESPGELGRRRSCDESLT